MQKIFGITLMSVALFSCGSYLLYKAKPSHKKQSRVTVDLDGACDENSYLTYGSSLLPNKPYIEKTEDLAANRDQDFLVVKKNQRLHDILSIYDISVHEIMALTKALSPYVRAKDLGVGDLYKVKLKNDRPGSLECFTIKKLDPNRLPITYEAKAVEVGFSVSLSSPKTELEDAYIRLKVKETLFASFKALPYGNELMQRLMNVFAWRMRMPEQVNKNDEIELVVTKIFALGEFIGYGPIKSVIYKKPQQTSQAFYYSSTDGKVNGYFDESGRSLEKEMMLSPVKNTTATSNQELRLHPVIKSRIRHNGIDFRGTIGTDFFAIADGEIIEKRFDKNVGNMIRIRHKKGVHSEYFHADSLVNKLDVGDFVRRGQKIGEIGRTGRLCTGPHLHLGLYVMHGEKRKYIDFKSLRKKLADMPMLSGAHAKEFQELTKKSLSFIQAEREKGEPTLAING